ncbi:MAG: molybdate ABC transporter substrate-binding protein [Deltaproteobacteria bacterium]|nr:molybdate ABC transporter substrate-binding protein [Deltaproteobacteria bacterium]
MREPLTQLAQLFQERQPEHRISLSFGPSNNLARQIRAGAPIDLFASADPRLIHALADKDLLVPSTITPLAGNKLVLIARAGLATQVDRGSLSDGSLERFALPNDAVPVGWYARSWLRNQKLLEKISPMMLRTEHARATLSAVDMGHADAALVYATDARLAKSAKVVLEIPAAQQPHILYLAAALSRDEATNELSSVFLTFLTSDTGTRVFADAGFAPAPVAEE